MNSAQLESQGNNAQHPIDAVDCMILSAEIDTLRVRNAVIAGKGNQRKFAILTRVCTSSGIVGESLVTVLGADPKQIHEFITGNLTESVRGLDIYAVEGIWQRMHRRTRMEFWNRPVLLRAMACVDAAIWDAVGKSLGLPLYKLWGGSEQSRVQVVMMDSAWHPEESEASLARRIEETCAAGFAGIKLKAGVHSPFGPVGDAERVRVARKAAGPDFLLFADANQGWSPSEALLFSRHVESAQISWLEEPCYWHNDKMGMAQVRAAGGVRIAAGQMESTAEACRELMISGSIDVCNLDATFSGVTPWRKVAAMADCFGIDMVHHLEPYLATALTASLPNGCHVETYDPVADPFFFGLIANRPAFRDGYMALPEDAGWGFRLDESRVAACRVH